MSGFFMIFAVLGLGCLIPVIADLLTRRDDDE